MVYINHALGFEIPPYGGNIPDNFLNVPYALPIQIKREDEVQWWTLPYEPITSISCKNIITKRNVQKQYNRRGTIKELWTLDDYEINISGLFFSKKMGELPEDDLRQLRAYCEARKALMVSSKLFTLFNINKIAVDSFSIPFTKGMENQRYTIKAYSDDVFDLLVDTTPKAIKIFPDRSDKLQIIK